MMRGSRTNLSAHYPMHKYGSVRTLAQFLKMEITDVEFWMIYITFFVV